MKRFWLITLLFNALIFSQESYIEVSVQDTLKLQPSEIKLIFAYDHSSKVMTLSDNPRIQKLVENENNSHMDKFEVLLNKEGFSIEPGPGNSFLNLNEPRLNFESVIVRLNSLEEYIRLNELISDLDKKPESDILRLEYQNPTEKMEEKFLTEVFSQGIRKAQRIAKIAKLRLGEIQSVEENTISGFYRSNYNQLVYWKNSIPTTISETEDLFAKDIIRNYIIKFKVTK